MWAQVDVQNVYAYTTGHFFYYLMIGSVCFYNVVSGTELPSWVNVKSSKSIVRFLFWPCSLSMYTSRLDRCSSLNWQSDVTNYYSSPIFL